MSFAESYMQKHGWTDGKGLGKNEHGAKDAIKVYKRFDKTGVGHDVSKEYTNNWWEKAYQSAANNITMTETKDEIVIKTQSKKSKKPKKVSLQFGTFVKSSSIIKNGVTINENKTEVTLDIPEEENKLPNVIALTDEELFKACGGRTAHKGARHGVTMTAKLNRIEMQESKILSGKISKKNKKSKKHKKKQKNL